MEAARVVLVMNDSDWTKVLPVRWREVDGFERFLGSKNSQGLMLDGK